MKFNRIFITIITFSILVNYVTAQNLKPYILAATSDASIAEVSDSVKINLLAYGLEVIGEYSPANDSNRKVFVVTSDELKNAVKTNGGLTGFASALRVELNEFDSFEEAVSTIDSNLANTEKLVYSVEFPEEKLKLYGIAVGGEKGKEHFLPIIDISKPQHVAFLPYELLITGKKAVMLHGRYRIALSFPDLTMMTFSKIMSTPGDIKKALQEYTK